MMTRLLTLALFALIACPGMVFMAQLTNYEQVGKGFVQQYYRLYDNAEQRAQLSNFYTDADTSFCLDDQHFFGKKKIVEHFNSEVGNKKYNHAVSDVQVQPTQDNGVVILVYGQQKVADGAARHFNQVFVVKQEGEQVKIHNNIFKYRD